MRERGWGGGVKALWDSEVSCGTQRYGYASRAVRPTLANINGYSPRRGRVGGLWVETSISVYKSRRGWVSRVGGEDNH